MEIYLTSILLLSWYVQYSVCDYTCLCSYDVEKPVYRSADTSYSPVGYLYEFDCRNVISNTDPVWAQIEFEHMVGFVEKNAQTKEQVCPGTPPDEDRIFTTTSIIKMEETVKTATLATSKVSMSPQVNVTIIDSNRQTTIEAIRPTSLATVTETTHQFSTKNQVTTILEYSTHSSGALLETQSPASTIIYTTYSAKTPGLISSTVNVNSFPETATRPSVQITSVATESTLQGSFATKQLSSGSVNLTSSPPTDITPTLTNQISQLPTVISPTSTLQFSTQSTTFITTSVSEILSIGPIPMSKYSTSPPLLTLTQQSVKTSLGIKSTAVVTVSSQLTANIAPTPTVKLTETAPVSPAETPTLPATEFSTTPTTLPVNIESTHLIQPSRTISLSAQSAITLVSPLFASVSAIINSALMSGPAASVTSTKSIEISSTAMATVTASPTSSTSSVLSGRVDLCPYRVLALCYNTTNHDYPCFRQYGEYCYELRLQWVNWFQARTDCQQRGGILLSVNNQATQTLILDMIPKFNNNRKPDIWIGLNDVRQEDLWQWADGSPLNETGFRPPFHINTVYSDLHDCVVMDGNTGVWRQTACKSFLFNSAVYPWVCQYKI